MWRAPLTEGTAAAVYQTQTTVSLQDPQSTDGILMAEVVKTTKSVFKLNFFVYFFFYFCHPKTRELVMAATVFCPVSDTAVKFLPVPFLNWSQWAKSKEDEGQQIPIMTNYLDFYHRLINGCLIQTFKSRLSGSSWELSRKNVSQLFRSQEENLAVNSSSSTESDDTVGSVPGPSW